MTEIIETISLKRFEKFIENHGHSIKFHEKNGGLNGGGFYMIEFTTAGELTANGTHCFAYYNGFPDDFDHSAITDINLEAFFDTQNIITSEDVNEINLHPIRGRLSIKPDGSLGYSLYISLKGGVTEEHLAFEFDIWLNYVSKCTQFIERAQSGIAQLEVELDRIFCNKTKK